MKNAPPHAPVQAQTERLFSLSSRNNIGYRLHLLALLLNRVIALKVRERFGIELREAHLLCLLEREPELHLQDLLQRTGLDKALVSRCLASLARQQLIRSIPAPGNHRYRTYPFTPAGLATARAVSASIKRLNRGWIGALSAEQSAVLDAALTALALAGARQLRATQGGPARRSRNGAAADRDQTNQADDAVEHALGVLSRWGG